MFIITRVHVYYHKSTCLLSQKYMFILLSQNYMFVITKVHVYYHKSTCLLSQKYMYIITKYDVHLKITFVKLLAYSDEFIFYTKDYLPHAHWDETGL